MKSPDFRSDEATPEVQQILDDRWAKYLANPESALTLDQLKEKMAKVLENEG